MTPHANAAAVPRTVTAELPRALRGRRPIVVTDLAATWAARTWTLGSLGSHHGAVRVKVARLQGSEVLRDPRRGLVLEDARLGAFVDSVARGAASGYLMTHVDELPPSMRDALPTPSVCTRGSRPVSKLWISSAGTVSSLHFDVQSNLHTVLSGAKRFLLFAPRDALRVHPYGLLSSVPNGAAVDPESPDLSRHPRFARARAHVAELRPGETLFIPAGWWHHVRSLEHTIAVNTWWAEGAARVLARGADLFKRLRGISR